MSEGRSALPARDAGKRVFSIRMSMSGSVRGLAERAKAVEDAGFDQVWTGNDLLGEPGVVALSAIAMSTTRIRFGSAVIDPVSLHPAQIAMIASGLQDLSDGRFLLGLGAGSDVFFRMVGIEPDRPVPRTTEAILAIRELVHGRSPAGVPGIRADWAPNAVLRFHRPVPIYVGAMGPKMLELTGRYADGALPLCLPPRHVLKSIEHVRRGAEAAGRSIDDLDVAACVWASVDDDADVAKHRLARHIAAYAGSLSEATLTANGLDVEQFRNTQHLLDTEGEAAATASVTPQMLTLGIAGGASEVIDQCSELLAAGVSHLSFGPPLSADPMHAVRVIGDQVLPELRRLEARA